MGRQHEPSPRRDLGGNGFAGGSLADNDQRIGAGKLRRQRRAQGPGGKHLAIADAAVAVDHDQRSIFCDRRILEAVIHQDHAGALRARQGDAIDTVARHRDRHVS